MFHSYRWTSCLSTLNRFVLITWNATAKATVDQSCTNYQYFQVRWPDFDSEYCRGDIFPSRMERRTKRRFTEFPRPIIYKSKRAEHLEEEVLAWLSDHLFLYRSKNMMHCTIILVLFIRKMYICKMMLPPKSLLLLHFDLRKT